VIRIYRPKAAPQKLKHQARRGLARALAALNAHGAASPQLKAALTDYDGGKASLFRAQHKKCVYCERKSPLAANALEHFRPKAEAWRHLRKQTPRRVEPGYWWLTWTWENMLFSCHSCNSGAKQNYFPLAPGSRRLTGPAAPYSGKRLQRVHKNTSVEDALLVDPASDDPLDHVEWRPVNPKQPKRLWKWSPRHLTPKGVATINVLGLSTHADLLTPHLLNHVLSRTEEICDHIDNQQYVAALAKWQTLGREVASQECDLAGPTWNALHHLVDPTRRQAAGLPDLPRP
jgi:hypothetical protein